MKKRLLAELLALCMVLAMLPVSALAAGDETDTPSNDGAESTLASTPAPVSDIPDSDDETDDETDDGMGDETGSPNTENSTNPESEPAEPTWTFVMEDMGSAPDIDAGETFAIKVTNIPQDPKVTDVTVWASEDVNVSRSAGIPIISGAPTGSEISLVIDTAQNWFLCRAGTYIVSVELTTENEGNPMVVKYEGNADGGCLLVSPGEATKLYISTGSDLVLTDSGQLVWQKDSQQTMPKVSVTDEYDNIVQPASDAPVQVKAEPIGNWSFQTDDTCVTTVTADASTGVATFEALFPNIPDEDVFGAAIKFTATDLSPAMSEPFTLPGGNLANKTVSLSGRAYYDNKITASISGVASGALTWSWALDGAAIEGATGSTYVVQKEDGGKTLTATATAQQGASLYTGSTTKCEGLKVDTTPLPDVLYFGIDVQPGGDGTDGTICPGDTLSVQPSWYGSVWLTLTYQWYTGDGTPIEGDTGNKPEYEIPDAAEIGSTYYVVASSNDGWENTFTGTVKSATFTVGQAVPTNPNVPDAPTDLTATPGNEKVTLSWTAPNDNGAPIVMYYVHYSDQSMGFAVLDDVKTTSHTVEYLTNGTTYTFWVEAVNAVGISDSSSKVKATPKAPSSGGSTESGSSSSSSSGSSGSSSSSSSGSSSSSSSGSSGSSSSESSGSAASTPATSGGNTSVDMTSSVSNGSATVTVSSSTAQALVNDAVKNHSTNVTITVEEPSGGAPASSVTANLPASTASTLADSTNASLTVDTSVATVVIPNRSLGALGSAGGTISVTASKAEDESVTVVVKKNGRDVGDLSGGLKVNVPVNTAAAQAGSGLVAVLVGPDGGETILPKSFLDARGEMKVLLDSGSATVKFVDNSKEFTDTAGHWASEAVAFVSSRDLFRGTESGAFQPDEPMNRAMLVTVLYRLEREPSAGAVRFTDVPPDQYYTQAVAWAADAGIVNGTDTGFNGDALITREQLATMLYRYVQQMDDVPGSMGSYAGMGGADQVHSWASDAMNWAVGSGIFIGNDGNLRPGDSASRSEVAATLTRFVDLITQ